MTQRPCEPDWRVCLSPIPDPQMALPGDLCINQTHNLHTLLLLGNIFPLIGKCDQSWSFVEANGLTSEIFDFFHGSLPE